MSATITLTRDRRRIRRLGLVSSLAVLVAFGTAACGGDDDNASSTTTSTSTSTTVAGQQSGGSNQGGSGQSGGGATGPTPTITSFSTPENIDCHNGNFQNFTASWSTTNAVRVAISGGGSNLPPSGETSLPFDCSSAHSFTLTAYGSGGKTATRSVTLQPRNVQQENTTDDT
jgi:hypothetical protein